MKTSKALFLLILFIAFLNTLTVNAQNTFPASGNVGIGLTNPAAKLHIVSPTTNGGHSIAPPETVIRLNRAGVSGGAWPNLADFSLSRYEDAHVNARTQLDISLLHNRLYHGSTLNGNNPDTTVMSLRSNGNVGIGTTNPDARLTLPNASTIKIKDPVHASWGTFLRNDANGNGYLGVAGHDLTLATGWEQTLNLIGGSSVSIGTNGGDASVETQMTIASDGNVAVSGNLTVGNTGDNSGLFFNAANEKSAYIGVQDDNDNGFFVATNGVYRLHVRQDGKVGVGTAAIPAGFLMAVDGKLICEEVKVQLSENWPDYVFAADYDLMPLNEVADYIATEKHLPGIPAASEIDGKGVEMGEMQRKMMEKIEELTLYMIQQQDQIATQQAQIEALNAQLQK